MHNSLALRFLLISLISLSMLPAFSQSEVKRLEEVGNRRIITLDVNRVADEISALLAAQDLTASDVTALTTALSGLTWADVLSNGSTSNTDVSLGNNDLSGVSTLTVELISGDSMVVAKVIDGRIGSLSNHTTDDLLEGTTNLYFTDTRARSSISGSTGVTYTSATGAISIGQSVGTTDDVSFAGVAASATVTADSMSVTDVINGQVDDISNHDTDDLSEGATNHYFTDARARSSISGGTGVTYTSATGAISIGQSVGTTDDVSFAGVAAAATVTADSISVTDVINGQVDDISNHDTDDLSEGATNHYFTDARARSSISGSTGVTYTSATGAISIGQSVGTTDDVSFAGVSVSATVTADSMSVTDVINGQVDDISNHDTDDLSEGASNLYFTDARAVSALSDTIAYLVGLIEALQSQTSGTAEFTCGTSTVTYQGYDYSTVEIGSQCWFAENLRSTNYNDDAAIPSGLDDATWSSTTDGAVTVYGEGGANAATNLATYGRLYNWHAVNTGKLCPSGWHVPADEEWTTLTDGLGGTSVAGNEMKSSASDTPSWDGTNNSGFSALPGGYRDLYDGNFNDEGYMGYWWSSSPYGSDLAWYRDLVSDYFYVSRYTNYQRNGLSVRCVRD